VVGACASLVLGLTMITAHPMSFFVPLFLMFLGWCSLSPEYQDEIRLRESPLVGFFLGCLVTLDSEWAYQMFATL
jgi:hypothetical protein